MKGAAVICVGGVEARRRRKPRDELEVEGVEAIGEPVDIAGSVDVPAEKLGRLAAGVDSEDVGRSGTVPEAFGGPGDEAVAAERDEPS